MAGLDSGAMSALVGALQPEDERFLRQYGWVTPPKPGYAERRRAAQEEGRAKFRREMRKVALQVTGFLAAVGLVAWLIVVIAEWPVQPPAPATTAATPSWHDSCQAFADIINNFNGLAAAVSNNQQVSAEAFKQADTAFHKMGC